MICDIERLWNMQEDLLNFNDHDSIPGKRPTVACDHFHNHKWSMGCLVSDGQPHFSNREFQKTETCLGTQTKPSNRQPLQSKLSKGLKAKQNNISELTWVKEMPWYWGQAKVKSWGGQAVNCRKGDSSLLEFHIENIWHC